MDTFSHENLLLLNIFLVLSHFFESFENIAYFRFDEIDVCLGIAGVDVFVLKLCLYSNLLSGIKTWWYVRDWMIREISSFDYVVVHFIRSMASLVRSASWLWLVLDWIFIDLEDWEVILDLFIVLPGWLSFQCLNSPHSCFILKTTLKLDEVVVEGVDILETIP